MLLWSVERVVSMLLLQGFCCLLYRANLDLFPHLLYYLLVFFVVFAINPFDIKLKGMLNEKLSTESAPLKYVDVESVTCTKCWCTFITCHGGHRDVTDHVGSRKAKAAEEALSSASRGNHHRGETAWRW